MLEKAYAKINLDLYILKKRPDGYHELSSMMHAIGLFDEVRVEKASKMSLSMTGDFDLSMEDNTAYKAAMFMKERFSLSENFSVEIKKNIPACAGVGGSSADAAAVIRAISALCQIDLSARIISRCGDVGADVPFLIRGGCALCEGIGEKITPLPTFSGYSILLCKPPEGVSTPECYKSFDEVADFTGGRLPKARSGLLPEKLLYNDLEAVAAAKLPVIGTLKGALMARGALGALMTGSGSGVFGLFKDEKQAMLCRDSLLALLPETEFFITEFTDTLL